jgi:hypothetical protein
VILAADVAKVDGGTSFVGDKDMTLAVSNLSLFLAR